MLESNYEKFEARNGESFQISFNSYDFQNNVAHDLLDYNVTIEDEDGHLYKVKQINNTPSTKNVVATHIYYDLIGYRKYDQLTGNRSFNEFANWLFNDSGWTFINVDVNENLNFNNFGNDNFLQLIQRLITKFDCEMQILPNKVIRFAKRIGRDLDKQYRYKNNIKSINQSVDTTNVRTRIIATGADNLSITYTSPLANNPLFGVLDAEPVNDNSITTQNELLEFAKASLNDIPETNIEVSVLDIDGEVGDYVWIIHEELGFEYQTRILSKTTRRDYNESEVEIGNAVKRTIEDALINQKEEVQQNKAEAEKAVSDLDEKTTAQTEEIRLFVENVEQTLNASIEITATQIRSEVNDINNNLQSSITQTATQIRSEVANIESNLNSTITQTANQINLRVNDNEVRIGQLDIRADRIQSDVINLENSTNSSITQLSNNINLKVDVGGSISDINLSQGAATINADKINLNGAVIVNGSITGSSNIDISNNASIGNALYFGNSGLEYIDISSGNMSFNSFGRFVFNGSIGMDVYGELRLNGKRVLTTDDLQEEV